MNEGILEGWEQFYSVLTKTPIIILNNKSRATLVPHFIMQFWLFLQNLIIEHYSEKQLFLSKLTKMITFATFSRKVFFVAF